MATATDQLRLSPASRGCTIGRRRPGSRTRRTLTGTPASRAFWTRPALAPSRQPRSLRAPLALRSTSGWCIAVLCGLLRAISSNVRTASTISPAEPIMNGIFKLTTGHEVITFDSDKKEEFMFYQIQAQLKQKNVAVDVKATTDFLLINGCRKRGTSIEDLAEKYPDMIIKVPIDVFKGITDGDAAKVVDGLALKAADRQSSTKQIKKLYELFYNCDHTLLEINPLTETASKKLVAADAKLNFDDNAAFIQKERFALHDTTQEDPREDATAKADLNYIGLDGEIGCMVNGAGSNMYDIIKLHGDTPANFLDVVGSTSEGQVVEAFKILTSDDRVKAILVNIFGGIMKCDVIASGIVNAAKQVDLKVPVVVRLEGTNVDQGKRILKESGMALITAEDLDDAAEKAVKASV